MSGCLHNSGDPSTCPSCLNPPPLPAVCAHGYGRPSMCFYCLNPTAWQTKQAETKYAPLWTPNKAEQDRLATELKVAKAQREQISKVLEDAEALTHLAASAAFD